MKLSEKLRELRKATNRTQQQVADEIGIHINTLKKYEDLKNDSLPNAVEIKKIKNYYNVSYEYLLEEDCFNKSDKNINIGKELGLTDKSIDYIKYLRKFECAGNTYYTNILVDEFNYFLENFYDFNKLLFRISFVKYYNNIYRYVDKIIDFSVKSVFNSDSDLAIYIKDLNFKELDSYILNLSQLVDSLEETYYAPDTILQNNFNELNIAYTDFKEIIKKHDIDKDIQVIRKSLEQILHSSSHLSLHADDQSDLNKFRISNISNEFFSKIK